MWIELVKLTVLLLAFSTLLTFVFRVVGINSIQSKLIQGALFGFIAIIGMSMPVHFSPGVIFDPRSVIVSIAGFLSGPWAAIPAGIIAGSYRIWLGGSGALAGSLVVLLSCIAGIAAYYLRERNYFSCNTKNFFIFGLVTHFFALFGLLVLPEDIMWKVIKNLSIPFFVFYPPMTALLGYLIDFAIRKIELEKQLVSSTSQLRGVFDASPDLMWLKDIDGEYIMCNRQFENFIGAPESEILGKTDYDFVDQELANKFRSMDQKAINSGRKIIIQEEFFTFVQDGKEVLLDTIKTPIYDEENSIIGVLGVSHDLTHRVAVESKLKQSSIVFENTSEGVIITDANATILDVNQAFIDITGYKKEDVIGYNPRILHSGKQDKEFFVEMWRSLAENGHWKGEICNKRKDGTNYSEWLTISAVTNENGKLINYVAVFSDISEIKASQQKLYYLAHHDPLTSLANRLLLNKILEESIRHAEQSGLKIAILFIDIDRFKNINDSFGHKSGDDLLKHISTNLGYATRKEDQIARISGDEFVVVLKDVDDTKFIISAIERIMGAVSSPFSIKEHNIRVTASIGVSLYPMDGADPETLIRNADAAMYLAKDEGRNTYKFYTRDLTEKAYQRVVMENELRDALSKDEFILYYQPQIDLKTRRIIGLEALVRWNHSIFGLVPPDQFIPLAEESGLINPIGEWIINQACLQGRKWIDTNKEFGKIAVNISSAQINQNQLVDIVSDALLASNLPPSFLELEVTEGAVMKKTDSAIEQMKELKSLGITLSVDDFGTGYSSLSYLKKLPISKLKIDQSFVHDIPNDNDDKAIVNAIISLGHSLGLTVIAEGVETEEQESYLRESKCHQAQGYLYSKPLCVEEINKTLRNKNESIDID